MSNSCANLTDLTPKLATNSRSQGVREAIAAVDEYFSTVKKNLDDPVYQMYSELREKLTALAAARRPGRPLGSKNKTRQTIPQVSIPRYYIGEKADGSRVSFRSTKVPARDGSPYVKVFGSFRRQASVQYRLDHSDSELASQNISMPVVF